MGLLTKKDILHMSAGDINRTLEERKTTRQRLNKTGSACLIGAFAVMGAGIAATFLPLGLPAAVLGWGTMGGIILGMAGILSSVVYKSATEGCDQDIKMLTKAAAHRAGPPSKRAPAAAKPAEDLSPAFDAAIEAGTTGDIRVQPPLRLRPVTTPTG